MIFTITSSSQAILLIVVCMARHTLVSMDLLDMIEGGL